MGAPILHALARAFVYPLQRSVRPLVIALGLASLPAVGCVVSLDGLTGGAPKADGGEVAAASPGGGAAGAITDAGTGLQQQGSGGGETQGALPDASSTGATDDAGSPSTTGASEAGSDTETGVGLGSPGSLVFGSPTSSSPTLGGDSGAPFSESCPQSAALVGLNLVVDTASPFSLLQVAPICTEIAVAPSGTLAFSAPAPLTLEGDEAGTEQAGTLMCPPGSVVTGMSVSAEKYLHSIVLDCALLVGTPADGSCTIGLGAATQVGPFGSGGYPVSAFQCPAPSVANALAGAAGGDGFLDSVVVGCATASCP